MENNDFDKKDLEDILNNFPNLKNIKNKNLIIFKEESWDILQKDCKNKLTIIYSIISDSVNMLEENINEDHLKLIFDYNDKHPDSKIPFKENAFLFFIGKLSSLEYIKKLCSHCYSIPLLFEGLIKINSSKELKDLTIHDIPYITPNDNILDLI